MLNKNLQVWPFRNFLVDAPDQRRQVNLYFVEDFRDSLRRHSGVERVDGSVIQVHVWLCDSAYLLSKLDGLVQHRCEHGKVALFPSFYPDAVCCGFELRCT
jgi:hypothetical protein